MSRRGIEENVKPARAWVPSHITGFFAAHRREEPHLSGSVGCGLCLSSGAFTIAEPAPELERTEIFLKGVKSEAPVSRFVAERLAGDRGPVRLRTELEMPFGAGFGASGAGALGAAYALNHCFDLGLTANQAAAVAHEAEVTFRTGLGDVIAQNCGGLVVRLQPGAPGTGVIDRIPVSPISISYVVHGPISTKEVLSDAKVMKAVNAAGEEGLKELLKKPTLANFMLLSRRFTVQSGLASHWALQAIEAVEAAGGAASMIMLGDAVFAWGGESEEALKDFGEVHTTTISQRGANLD
ncbi:MAG: GHMP kinase [Methanothrix sp.]